MCKVQHLLSLDWVEHGVKKILFLFLICQLLGFFLSSIIIRDSLISSPHKTGPARFSSYLPAFPFFPCSSNSTPSILSSQIISSLTFSCLSFSPLFLFYYSSFSSSSSLSHSCLSIFLSFLPLSVCLYLTFPPRLVSVLVLAHPHFQWCNRMALSVGVNYAVHFSISPAG